MNSPSSDGSENVIDIFVLCKSETETPLSTEHLEQKGYRVTLFSDSPHLLETLHFGKPNLLICDSLSLGQEAYEVCRQIKADNELWMVPVLILTGASSLGDLLYVLDCNADNFIAYPSDPHYLLSLIEGMLVTPVERQTPDQIKTQFKIQHDDHMFVVTADRRKLLEFLLSSFEIAVNKSDDLGRERNTNTALQDSLRKIQEAAAEQNRILAILNSTLQQKEQDISSLNAEIKDKARQIAELDREKEFLLKERDENKISIAAGTEKIRALEQEKDEASRSHTLESGQLSQRISDLTEELNEANADLKGTKQALVEETARRGTAESTLSTLVPEKEQVDKALRAATLECEQLKSAVTDGKNRAAAAEQEAKSLLQAKTQSEQDLTRIIDDLKETAKQQAGELIALKDERVADKNRISTLEVQLGNLATEKEQVESGLRKAAEDLRMELSETRGSLESATAALEEKSGRLGSLEEVFAGQKAIAEKAQARVQSLETELGVIRFALEQEKQQHASTEETLQGALRERDAALSTLQGAHDEVKSDLSAHRDDLVQVKQDLAAITDERTALRGRLDETAGQVKNLEEKLQLASRDQAESDKQVRSLADELDAVKATLEAERRQRRAGEDSLKTAATSAEKAGEQLRASLQEQDQLKAALEADREAIRKTQEQVLQSLKEQDRLKAIIESDRDAIRQAEEQVVQSRKEQDRLKAIIESDRDAIRRTEEQVVQSRKEQDRLRDELGRAQNEARRSEEQVRAEHGTHERRILEVSSDLAAANIRVQYLEEQVRVITHEKFEAEQKASSLAAEIDQARTALADEWEDHMTANERLEAAVHEKNRLESSLQQPAEPAKGVAEARAVVTRTSNLPAEVPPAPRAIVSVPVPAAEMPVRRVSGVEDLFEDDGAPGEDADELPVVSIVRDPDPVATMDPIPCTPAPEIPEIDDDPAEEAGDDEEVAGDASGEGPDSEDEGEEAAGEEEPAEEEDEDADADEGDAASGRTSPPVMPSAGISFNRAQWFDLLKWAHHSGALTQEQRLQIVRMGRLIQRGRRLTQKQDGQVREMLVLVQSLGYRFG